MSFEIEWEIVLFLVAFLSGCLATLERVGGKTCYCYCGYQGTRARGKTLVSERNAGFHRPALAELLPARSLFPVCGTNFAKKKIFTFILTHWLCGKLDNGKMER